MRLDRLIAGQGTLSRREVKLLAWGGRILVNGVQVKAADIQVETDSDIVELDGKRIILKEHIYIMLNKPKGVVSATSDPKLPTVIDLVPEELMRKKLFPAGRLDKDTEGFVLITDDGVFAHKILAPKNKLPKQYLAVLNKPIDEAVIAEFAAGVKLGDDEKCSPAQLTVLENIQTAEVEVIIYEGMYHQIKRMFERFGYKVMDLQRQRIGGLWLDENLPLGECREITQEEIAKLIEPMNKG